MSSILRIQPTIIRIEMQSHNVTDTSLFFGHPFLHLNFFLLYLTNGPNYYVSNNCLTLLAFNLTIVTDNFTIVLESHSLTFSTSPH